MQDQVTDSRLSMPTNDLLYDMADGYATVTLNRPQARNAITFEMYEGLAEICRTIHKSDTNNIRALIITGAGDKAFAAGTDIAQFRDFHSVQDAINYEKQIDTVLTELEQVPIPTIAAIQGACTGGGAAIAACCDLRIATRNLKFGFPIAKTLGNCLSIKNLSRLAGLLGVARTKEILFTSRLIEAEEALQIALVSEIVSDLMPRAQELAAILAEQAPLTLHATKVGLRRLQEQGAQLQDQDLIKLCYCSNDFREGLDAFLSKRKPKWTGS